MKEKLRILMYSERMVEEHSINFLLQNEFNDIYLVSDFKVAVALLFRDTFHLIFIDYRQKNRYDDFAEIMVQRRIIPHIVIVNLQLEDHLKELGRLSSTIKRDVISDGNWIIDPQSKTVTYNNQSIDLTVTEFDLLYCLARNKNKTVTYEMIIEFVWGYDREYDNSLKTHISRLGKKLSAVTGGKHIINKRSVGYMFSK